MISNVIIHLNNELPILVDLYEAPAPADRSVRCTNVRTVDGRRPSFVHDPRATFVFPWSVIRLIEMPATPTAAQAADTAVATAPQPEAAPPPPLEDEEPDEDLLARIRSV